MAEKKVMKCKNTLPGTNIKCNTELCETDGVSVFVPTGNGDYLEVTPTRGGDARLTCPNPKCKGKTVWYRSKTVA